MGGGWGRKGLLGRGAIHSQAETEGPASLEIFTGEFGSINIDQSRSPKHPPSFSREFFATFMPRASKGRATFTGPKPCQSESPLAMLVIVARSSGWVQGLITPPLPGLLAEPPPLPGVLAEDSVDHRAFLVGALRSRSFIPPLLYTHPTPNFFFQGWRRGGVYKIWPCWWGSKLGGRQICPGTPKRA